MKRFFDRSRLLIAGLLMVAGTGCEPLNICENGRGKIQEETLDLPSFAGVEVKGKANVYLSMGDSQVVVVKTEENVLDELDFQVVDDVLVIDLARCFYSYNLEVFITLDRPLRRVEVSGAGDVYTLSKVDAAQVLALSVSGSGEISLEGDADRIENRISGAGGINLSGSANSVLTRISGSGQVDTYSLPAQDHKVELTGSGRAKVAVEGGTLEVSISGSGTVFYRGQPGSINTAITGTGRLVDDN